MCVMDIMNILRTGMNMSNSRIHIWLCYRESATPFPKMLSASSTIFWVFGMTRSGLQEQWQALYLLGQWLVINLQSMEVPVV